MANKSKPITISVNGVDITESVPDPSVCIEFLPTKEPVKRSLVKLEPLTAYCMANDEVAYSFAKWRKQNLKRLNKGDDRGKIHCKTSTI